VVDRILKGADPAEIPIDRTMRGPTILNVKAAELLGLHLPAQLIDEADVILDTIRAD
jgi:putative ABC transport system substrate-binding protein